MSTAEFEASGLQEFEEIYFRLSECGQADYRDTWRLFAANQRFQRELERAARRVAKTRGLPGDRVPDIVQEALLVLADRLHARADLGFDARWGREHFVAWIRAVARSHCRHAVARQRAKNHRYSSLDREWPEVASPRAALQAELAEAAQSLSEPLRSVVEAFGELGSVEAVARRLGLSPTTAWRRFRAAVRQLRPRCRGYLASGRLVGLEHVAQKW